MRRTSITVATLALFVVAASAAGMPKSAGAAGSLQMSSGTTRLATLEPAKGDTVSLAATYTGVRKQDAGRVQLLCSQNIGGVYADALTLNGSPQTVSFKLGENSTTATSV